LLAFRAYDAAMTDTVNQRFFKTGIVVTDLEAAMAELGGQLGVEWTPVQAVALSVRTQVALEELELNVVVSREGPTYLELIEAQPEGYYAAPDGSYLHHVGLWVDDLAAESKRLEAAGWEREAAGEYEGVSPVAFAFHRSPWGLRIELGDRANVGAWDAWTSGAGLQF
jgi:hypothetical protein